MALKSLLTDTSRWSIEARLAIAFAHTCCHVCAVCPTNRHPLQYASVVQKIFPYSGFRPVESLRAAIAESQPDLVVPYDESGVRHLHELFQWASREGGSQTAVADLIVRSLGSPERFPVVTSRHDLLAIAQEEGIRVPDTRSVTGAADLEVWETQQKFPWVLKAD